MKFRLTLTSLALAGAAMTLPSAAFAFDEEAAKVLARDNNCLKCHAISRDKDGPSLKKIAEKYKGKSDAVPHLVKHLTSGEKAKFPDGHEEEHKIVKTDPANDQKQIANLVEWILSK